LKPCRCLIPALLVTSAVSTAQDALLNKGDVARIVDEYLSAQQAADPSPFDALSIYGDLRLRQEQTTGLSGAPQRHRSRVRLRLGSTWLAHENLEVGARAVTGSRLDPRSSHVTLGDGLDGLELSLDRAYATWRPQLGPITWVSAGKFSNPVRRNPVYGELVWDADIQPEGLALEAAWSPRGWLDSLELSLGQWLLSEQQLGDDAVCTFGQVALQSRLQEGVETHMSAALTLVHDPTPGVSSILLDDNRGNNVIAGDFAENFGVLDVNADVSLSGAGTPWVVSAEWIDNVRASQTQNGWATGVAWGRAARAGDWRVYYQWQSIDRDAVFSPFAQDDFTRATGFDSHLLGVNHQLTDGVGLHLWGMVSEASELSSNNEWRLRLDLNVKF